MEELICVACEQRFLRHRTLGRRPTYCSPECRREVERAPATLERLRFDRQLYVTRGPVYRRHVAIADADIRELEALLSRASSRGPSQ